MNRCSMRVCFCPNMAVVAVENPLLGAAGLINERHHCGKAGLLSTLVHKPMNKLVLTKVIFGAYLSLHVLPMERMKLLLMYNVVHKTTIHTDCVTNRAGSCGGILLKMLQNVIIKLRRANWSLRPEKCLFTANVCLEDARDKFCLLPCPCHTLHLMPSECGRVQPRWSTACWCPFD